MKNHLPEFSSIFGSKDQHPLELLLSYCDDNDLEYEFCESLSGSQNSAPVLNILLGETENNLKPYLELIFLSELFTLFDKNPVTNLYYLRMRSVLPFTVPSEHFSNIMCLISAINSYIMPGLFSLFLEENSTSEQLVSKKAYIFYQYVMTGTTFRPDSAVNFIELSRLWIFKYTDILYELIKNKISLIEAMNELNETDDIQTILPFPGVI